jgi:hypothetical protein
VGVAVVAVAAVAAVAPEETARAWLTAHVLEGLRSGLPDLVEDVPGDAFEAGVREFIAAPAFYGEASLRARFCSWLRDGGHTWAERASLEHLVRRRPHRDEEAELFGAVPEGEARGRLRMNRSARTGVFTWVAAQEVLGWENTGGSDRVGVIVAWFDGSARAMVLDADVEEVLEAVREHRGEVCPRSKLIAELVSKGIVVWLPHVEAKVDP